MNKGRLEQLFALQKSNPSDTFILFAIAKEYMKLNEPETGLKYFRQLLENDPDYTGAYYHLGKLYESLNEVELARSTYEKGMKKCQQLGAQHDYSELAGALQLISEE